MALPQEDKGVKKTPSDKDALPDRRKATPRNEELAELIGEKISEVMPTKEETMEQNKVLTAMAGYLEILAGKAESDDGPAAPEESAFSKLGKLGKILALALGTLIGLFAAQLKTIMAFAKLFTPARLQVQIRAMFRGLTGTVKGFGAAIRGGFATLLKPLTGIFKGARGLGKSTVIMGSFLNGLKGLLRPFGDLFKLLKGAMKSVGSSVSIFGRISGFFRGIGQSLATFGKAVGAVAKIASKVFFPLLIILTLFDTIKGAFEGFSEGGIIGGIAGAIKGLFNSLIFGPLDMIKGALAWVLDFFGFEKAAELLNSFSFADLFSALIDGIAGFVSHIASFIGNIIMAPIRPIIELFNSLMNIFTNTDGEGLFKNISDFFFDLILIIPKFFLNILDAIAGLFGFDGLREKIYGFFDTIMDNLGIPAFSFTIPFIKKKIEFGGFFPFRDEDPEIGASAGDEGGTVEATSEAIPPLKEEDILDPSRSKDLEKLDSEINSQIEGDIQKQLDKEAEITKSGLESMRQAGGNTTVVNNTNVSNQANTQTSSMAFPKSAKNNDNDYFQNKYNRRGR